MHSGMLTWQKLHDVVSKQARRTKDTLFLGAELYAELLDLWELHGGDDAKVAAQLFGADPPTADQIQMARDAHGAITEMRRLWDEMDGKALRRMA